MWAAVDLSHIDGPWDPPEHFRKINAAARFSHGDAADGFSLTAMYYKSGGGLLTDQPLRAIQAGLIGPYGTLDPSDHSDSMRWSVSGRYATQGSNWSLATSAYLIHSTMTLWNNFTHDLDDPVNGDQRQQERESHHRRRPGGLPPWTPPLPFGDNQTVFGVQGRYDEVEVDRHHTKNRVNLFYCELEQPTGPALPYAVGLDACNDDQIHLGDLAAYVQNTTHVTPWLRTILGGREELYVASDHSLTTGFRGSDHQWLFQPKGSLVIGPFYKTELYVSAGRGFHSDDVRGVFGTVPLEGEPTAAGPTPLLAPATGYEVGLRTNIIPRLAVQVAPSARIFSPSSPTTPIPARTAPAPPAAARGSRSPASTIRSRGSS